MHNSASSLVENDSGSMLAQLETIMSSVRREANELDSLKSKIAESDELKRLFIDSKSQLLIVESEKNELQRTIENNKLQIDKLLEDFKNLNDVCNNERMLQMSLNDMLQQKDKEISRLKTELSYSQKESQKNSELRKSNQSLTNQITQKQIQFETDVSSMKSSIRALESQLLESDKQKSEISGHFWRATEELNTLRLEGNTNQNIIEALQKDKIKCYQDCMELREICHMSGEETEGYKEIIYNSSTEKNRHALEIQKLYDSTKLAMDSLKNENIQQQLALQELQSSHSYQLLVLASKEEELKAILASSSAELAQSKQELEVTKAELTSLQVESLKNSQSLIELTTTLTSTENRRIEVEKLFNDSQSELESLQLQLRTLAFRFQSLQTQFQDEQSQHWQSLQELKAVELTVTNENHVLVAELEEVHRRLDDSQKQLEFKTTEADKNINNANTITLALRTELEKRIGELTSAVTERDTIRLDFTNLNKSYMEMQEVYKQKETQFHSVMEQEFSRFKKDIQAKGSKLQSLEQDKMNLLEENSELMRQLQNYSKAQKDTQNNLEALTVQFEEMRAQLQPLKTANTEQSEALEAALQRETELLRKLTAAETNYNEELSKLEGVVKVTKKVAAQQVNEVATRVRQKLEEAGDIKTRNLELENSLKSSIKEVEAVKEELNQCKISHSQMQQRMAHDVAVLREECNSLTANASLERETKRKLETETLELRLHLTNLESELRELQDSLASTKLQLQIAEESALTSTKTKEESENECKRLLDKVIVLEESLRKKCTRIDELTSCLRVAEAGLKEENGQLRKRLEDSMKELETVNQTLGQYKKENDDIKASFQRLQSTTSVTMTGLLTELRSTEATLLDERTNFQNDISMYEEQLLRLKENLETSRANLEELRNRHRQERSQYDEQVAQLELEIAQLRFTLASKESRALELEKMFSRDKELVQELRETLVVMDHDKQDCQQQLDRERQIRKRLEDKSLSASHSLVSPSYSSNSLQPLPLPLTLDLQNNNNIKEADCLDESHQYLNSNKVSAFSRLLKQHKDNANSVSFPSPLFTKADQLATPSHFQSPYMSLDDDSVNLSVTSVCFDSSMLPSPYIQLPLPLPLPRDSSSRSSRSNAAIYPEVSPELWSDGYDVQDKYNDTSVITRMAGEAMTTDSDYRIRRDTHSSGVRSSQKSRGKRRLSPLSGSVSGSMAIVTEVGKSTVQGLPVEEEHITSNVVIPPLPLQQDGKVSSNASMRAESTENDFLPYSQSPNRQYHSENPSQKSSDSSNDLADETIRRTQQYLNRRRVAIPLAKTPKKEAAGKNGGGGGIDNTATSSLLLAERDTYPGSIAAQGKVDRDESSQARTYHNLEAMPKYEYPLPSSGTTRSLHIPTSTSLSTHHESPAANIGLSSNHSAPSLATRDTRANLHQEAKQQLPKLMTINNKRNGKNGR